MKKKIITQTIIISNIQYIYPELPTENCLRISVGALSLHNQKSDINDNCHPMICGWNENPAVEFADFQWWLKCRIEESNFIVGEKTIPFKKRLSLFTETSHGEFSATLVFKDGTQLRLVARDIARPIQICVIGKKSGFIKRKIKEYGYTGFFE